MTNSDTPPPQTNVDLPSIVKAVCQHCSRTTVVPAETVRAAIQSPVSNLQPPEDWLIVPRVASKEMQEAAMHYLLGTGNIYARDEETVVVETTTPGDVWRAMLDAAPTQPAPKPDGTS